MPGLNIIYFKNDNLEISSSQKDLLFKNNRFALTALQYDGYPIRTMDYNSFLVVIEGFIYDKEGDLNQELQYAADLAFSSENQQEVQDNLHKWVHSVDGEFLVILINKKTSELILINDALGRLPLYLWSDENQILISRNIDWIIEKSEVKGLNKEAVGQYLLFGYSLGESTIYKGINRLLPNLYLYFSEREFIKKYLYIFNFQKKREEYNIDELVQLFEKGLKERSTSDRKTFLGLSGGLDSRAVAGGLSNLNIDCTGVTRLSFNKVESSDFKISKEISRVLGLRHKIIEQSKSSSLDDLSALFKAKRGLNNLAMSFMTFFLENIKSSFGQKIVYFTGDGGDKVLVSLIPSKKLSSSNDVVDYVIDNSSYFSLDVICSLLNLDKEQFLLNLQKHIEDYPEESASHKYVHFMIYERAFKWLFEGEDRNRFYFWSTTPFYSLKFFKYAITIKDKEKNNYKLYRHFLEKLSEPMVNVKNANWNLSLKSKKLPFLLKFISIVQRFPWLKDKIKFILSFRFRRSKGNFKSTLSDCIMKQIEDPVFRDYFDIPTLRSLLERNEHQTETNLYTMLTITTSIEKNLTGISVLDNKK